MNLLLTKLILTPLVILAALWVARRWGDAFGGWLAGLPLTSAPVAAFLAIEHGPAFAAAASAGSVAAVASQASFCMAYTAASRRGWQRGALLGAVGFAGSAAIVQALELPLPALLGLSAVLLSLARLAMPRAGVAFAKTLAPRWEIPARVILVTAIVVAVTYSLLVAETPCSSDCQRFSRQKFSIFGLRIERRAPKKFIARAPS